MSYFENMAHTRRRHVEEAFLSLLKFSPIVGLFGHRQVGKTTFASLKGGTYWTLDDQDTRQWISDNPKKFLSQRQSSPVVIDECQLAPSLFPALKEHIRTHKAPGQFILTGSVRFTSRRAIRESLAGRMTSLELLPFTVAELMQNQLSDALPELMKTQYFSETSLDNLRTKTATTTAQHNFQKYLTHGGLPGLCFIRNDRLRNEALLDVLRLILDRDLRIVVETKVSLETLLRWLRWISTLGLTPYNASKAKSMFGFAHQTQRGLLSALESIFLLRRIPLWGRTGSIFLFEDQIEETLLSDNSLSFPDQILSAFFRNMRAQFLYRLGNSARFESFWLRSGAHLPLVVRTEAGCLAFATIDDAMPSISQRRSAESFERREPKGKVIFLRLDTSPPRILDSRTLICAASALL